MNVAVMNVEVKFFASLRETAGTGALQVQVPEGSGYDDLMAALEQVLGAEPLAALTAENVRLARNQHLVTPPFRLSDGDELAFLPPVTGG